MRVPVGHQIDLIRVDPFGLGIGQTGSPLRVFRNGDDIETVLVGDLPGAPEPDRRLEGQDNPPATAFELADRTKDGRISQAELRGPSMPMAPPVAAAAARNASQNGQGGTGPGQSGVQQSTSATPGARSR